MTESPGTPTHTDASPVVVTEDAHHNNRLYRALAWVGIIAGVLFIVAVVFFSGFLAGRSADGYGWHRGWQNGQMQPGGMMGSGCPMMQMMPGGMGPGMMPGGMGPGMMPGMTPGGMGPGGMRGPNMAPTTPMPPPTGQR
ncbi:hypothetical protein MI149_29600 (plasmid) [Mycolicibacterium crocinum]|uniref:Uncharacterized protein n=1 Tax=Mycolicibacterium crocinum TaxID=388459 RepID=A0ABY3TXR2_9MYCO|nr:hypothetical protein [Mycolicibacterium crocinum]ULN44836.1 hypothetical protein MI149_29600 [Mycolicibacterium crocinum]